MGQQRWLDTHAQLCAGVLASDPETYDPCPEIPFNCPRSASDRRVCGVCSVSVAPPPFFVGDRLALHPGLGVVSVWQRVGSEVGGRRVTKGPLKTFILKHRCSRDTDRGAWSTHAGLWSRRRSVSVQRQQDRLPSSGFVPFKPLLHRFVTARPPFPPQPLFQAPGLTTPFENPL